MHHNIRHTYPINITLNCYLYLLVILALALTPLIAPLSSTHHCLQSSLLYIASCYYHSTSMSLHFTFRASPYHLHHILSCSHPLHDVTLLFLSIPPVPHHLHFITHLHLPLSLRMGPPLSWTPRMISCSLHPCRICSRCGRSLLHLSCKRNSPACTLKGSLLKCNPSYIDLSAWTTIHHRSISGVWYQLKCFRLLLKWRRCDIFHQNILSSKVWHHILACWISSLGSLYRLNSWVWCF